MAQAPAAPLFRYGLAEWQHEPEAAFDAFLSSHRFNQRQLRPSSFTVYRGMFGRLRVWAAGQGHGLLDLDEARLSLFLQGRTLSEETRHRYLLVFTSLFAHLAQLRLSAETATPAANPARALLLAHNAPLRDDPEWLTPAEVRAFIGALPPLDSKNWKRVRDRALALLVLGAGLRSSEVLALKLSDINRKTGALETIWVQAQKPRPARQVPVHLFAVQALEAWLTLRAKALGPAAKGGEQGATTAVQEGEQEAGRAIAGELVFPASPAGAPLTQATLFRLVKKTLEAAGVAKRYEGPTLLRNTCGTLWLQKSEPWQVMAWMGHATLRTTELLLPSELRTSASAGSGAGGLEGAGAEAEAAGAIRAAALAAIGPKGRLRP